MHFSFGWHLFIFTFDALFSSVERLVVYAIEHNCSFIYILPGNMEQLIRKASFHPRIKAALPALSLAPASSVQVPFGDDPTLSVSLGHYSGIPGSTRRPYAEGLLSQKVQWHAKRSWLRHERPN